MKTIELLNDNQRKLKEQGGPINHADLLDPQPSESILIRAMLEEMFEESDMWLVSD